jgi:hypothetical protein
MIMVRREEPSEKVGSPSALYELPRSATRSCPGPRARTRSPPCRWR